MTSAPPNISAVRTLLLAHLDFNPSKTASTDLDPAEVGIVGDAAHRGGYHCGKDRVVANDYSVYESPRDRAGLSDYASALDVGEFSWRNPHTGEVHNLRTFSVWLVGECQKGTQDTQAIREIIYSPDGKTVHRWDRLRKRTTGDSSHLTHTHTSFFRDARGDLTPVYRRYLIHIGLIAAPAAPPPQPSKEMPMLMLQLKGQTAVWLSWGPDRGRVVLVDIKEMPSGVPFIVVNTEARLAAIGGKVLG